MGRLSNRSDDRYSVTGHCGVATKLRAAKKSTKDTDFSASESVKMGSQAEAPAHVGQTLVCQLQKRSLGGVISSLRAGSNAQFRHQQLRRRPTTAPPAHTRAASAICRVVRQPVAAAPTANPRDSDRRAQGAFLAAAPSSMADEALRFALRRLLPVSGLPLIPPVEKDWNTL